MAALWLEPWRFQWHQINVTYSGGVLSESIDGNPIASYSVASVGSDIFLGMYDFNDGSAGVTGLADQNYVLFDNLVVTQVPVANQLRSGRFWAGAGLFLVRRHTRKASIRGSKPNCYLPQFAAVRIYF